MKFYKYLTATFIIICTFSSVSAQQKAASIPDVVYVPTQQKIVEAMLLLANVSKADTVYDLGCGDGRIVISAAKQFGANGICIELDSNLIKIAQENARQAEVSDKIRFVEADLFKTDFSGATVIMLYLSPGVNLKLRPYLLKKLKPGTRIISHDFDMGEWKADKVVSIDETTLYLWTVPAKTPAFRKPNQ